MYMYVIFNKVRVNNSKIDANFIFSQKIKREADAIMIIQGHNSSTDHVIHVISTTNKLFTIYNMYNTAKRTSFY